jgi:hypothetical protein
MIALNSSIVDEDVPLVIEHIRKPPKNKQPP